MDQAAIASAVLGLDAWLETMRGPEGYTGPVAHWWRNCFQYAGVGLDWRYEGITIGYLNLYRRSGEGQWLGRARRAGDDLVAGQLKGGNYRCSGFELNPFAGGTPHEAACDLALLNLAEVLHEQGDGSWQGYLAAAQRNLTEYHIGKLWDPEVRAFRDHPRIPSLVPNKAATLVEALTMLARLTGDEKWAQAYALPTLDAVVNHQVKEGPLQGAIHQYSSEGRAVPWFFPFYIARCVPGLVAGYEQSGEGRYLEAALAAMRFVLDRRYHDGSFPQVIYPGGHVNRYPQWIAGTADMLRAMDLLRRHGLDADPAPTLSWLLGGRLPSGGFRTAWGFASQTSQKMPPLLPDFRDILPVVGWSSMVFRYLTSVCETTGQAERVICDFDLPCGVEGRPCEVRETGTRFVVTRGSELVYAWTKGTTWAEACSPELVWK